MHLDNLRILPGGKPGCVVEGRFGLESPHYPGGDPVPLEGARISLSMGGRFGAGLGLIELEDGTPGFCARPSKELSLYLHLPAAIDLERLLVDMTRSAAPQGPRRVEWATLYACGEFGRVSGLIPSLDVETRVLEAGLGVKLSGEVGSLMKSGGLLEPPVPVPVLADSCVHAEIVIPWAYLIIQRSPLAALGNRFQAPWKQGGPLFDMGRPGLSGVAFDRNSGSPFFQGPFVVERGKASPCLMVADMDEILVLDPCGTPLLLPDGFAASNSYTFGPRLTLFGMGHGMWTKILGGDATGSLELKGDCVGFLTEARVLGAVAGRHAIVAYHIDLALGETELVVKINGEVGRQLQYEGPSLPSTLGPRFEVTMKIPAAFLAARGIDLVGWGASEKRLLKGESIQ